jgi:hypothetical protein
VIELLNEEKQEMKRSEYAKTKPSIKVKPGPSISVEGEIEREVKKSTLRMKNKVISHS